MAIKAGRVGVAPSEVDEFGQIIGEITPTNVYTKQQADTKFETQTHAASTYETKSDAAALQPKTLSVPIDLLTGSVLTVEGALNGINEIQKGTSAAFGYESGTPTTNSIVKRDGIVYGDIRCVGVTREAWANWLTIPEGYRPSDNTWVVCHNLTDKELFLVSVNSAGTVNTNIAITDKELQLHAYWKA